MRVARGYRWSVGWRVEFHRREEGRQGLPGAEMTRAQVPGWTTWGDAGNTSGFAQNLEVQELSTEEVGRLGAY